MRAPEPAEQTSTYLRRAIGGDDAGLELLVRRLNPLLLAHAAYRLGPGPQTLCEPEDLVHEAWLETLPRLGNLHPREGRYTPVLLRFLGTTVLYKVRNLLRRQAREGGAGPTGGAAAPPSDVTASQSGVISQAIRHEEGGRVRAALEELDPDDRVLVLLRAVEQQTNKDAGMLLGISPDLASKRYRRALERLRVRLPGSVFAELDAS